MIKSYSSNLFVLQDFNKADSTREIEIKLNLTNTFKEAIELNYLHCSLQHGETPDECCSLRCLQQQVMTNNSTHLLRYSLKCWFAHDKINNSWHQLISDPESWQITLRKCTLPSWKTFITNLDYLQNAVASICSRRRGSLVFFMLNFAEEEALQEVPFVSSWPFFIV